MCNWPNPRWQNSRWLPSKSWVRMNEFESDWITLSQSFVQNGWIQDGRIQDDRIQDCSHHQGYQIEFIWVRFRMGEECFWLNMREDNKVSESKMPVSKSNTAEFKMAAIIKLSQNERVKFYYVQIGPIQYGRIQDGCHHQVEWEWMSLNQIELVWVRVRVEEECFWGNLIEDNKVSESKVAMSESRMAEFTMAAIIKLCQNEWVKFYYVQIGPIQYGRIQDGFHHQVESEWMSMSQIKLVWMRVFCKMAESKMPKFKMATIMKLIRLN